MLRGRKRKKMKILESMYSKIKTFDNFNITSKNQKAFNIARQLAERENFELENIIYIYGPTGSGKSHLLSAIGNAISIMEKYNLIYTTAYDFVTNIILAIRESPEAQVTYQNKLRSADILLIDDIQYLVGRESVTETFFMIVDYLVSGGKLVIITGDTEPSNYHLDERLKRRLHREWS